jgi:hypothetical protein
MKYTILILLSLNFAYGNYKEKCSLGKSMKPMCYHKRDRAVLNIAVVNYGQEMSENLFLETIDLLKVRFLKATQNKIGLNVIKTYSLHYKHPLPNDYTFNDITDKKRLHRIWYYDNVGVRIMQEVYEEYKKIQNNDIYKLDAILIVTGAQFNGLGFANGRISVTEYPREIAWGLPDGGRVYFPTKYELVDEFIHELGHNMFLGHTSTHCQNPELTLDERKACCEQSPSRDDVLSYCRKRSKVSSNFMFGFESCNLEMIDRLIVPAMISGGRWNVPNRTRCL